MEARNETVRASFDVDGWLTTSGATVAHTLLITLTGMEEQIWGYICFFHAFYNCRGLEDEQFDHDEFLQRYQEHFQLPGNEANVSSFGQRFVIDISGFRSHVDYIRLLTNNLPAFVSGMERVPPAILLPEVTLQPPEGMSHFWKKVSPYIDLTHERNFGLYTTGSSIVFDNQPDISTVKTYGIPSLEVRYESL